MQKGRYYTIFTLEDEPGCTSYTGTYTRKHFVLSYVPPSRDFILLPRLINVSRPYFIMPDEYMKTRVNLELRIIELNRFNIECYKI